MNKMSLDEIKSLDPRNISEWPIFIQISALVGTFCIILLATYFYIWSPQLNELHVGVAREEVLKRDFLEKKKQAVNLEAYQAQLLEIKNIFNEMLKQLPNKSEMETLLIEVNHAGVGRGLLFDLFKPGQETKTDTFSELPIAIKITGPFHDLASFISDLAQLSRIVTVNNIQLSASEKNPSLLILNATIKTYRSLDQAEMQPTDSTVSSQNKNT